MGKLVIRTKQAPPPGWPWKLFGCCCVEEVVVVVFVVVGRIAYFIWPFQQPFFCELHEKGAPDGDEEDKAKKRKVWETTKKNLLYPTQLPQGRHHKTKNLRERERERSDAKRTSAELVEFSAFQKPKDLLLKWHSWTSCVDRKQLTFGSSALLCAKYIGATWLYIRTRGVSHYGLAIYI